LETKQAPHANATH